MTELIITPGKSGGNVLIRGITPLCDRLLVKTGVMSLSGYYPRLALPIKVGGATDHRLARQFRLRPVTSWRGTVSGCQRGKEFDNCGMARKKPAQDAAESLEYVKAWASDLVAAVGKREARRILDDYKAISGNKRLAKADRDIAARRARILSRLL